MVQVWHVAPTITGRSSETDARTLRLRRWAVAEVVFDPAGWCRWPHGGPLGVRPVAVDRYGGESGCVGGAEVGSVATEDVDPLAPGLLHGWGDEVGGVAVLA